MSQPHVFLINELVEPVHKDTTESFMNQIND